MPPLQECFTLLASLRAATDTMTPITILLVGKPQGHNYLTPAQAEQVAVWCKKIEALADPSFDILELVANA